jgi:hypothetical protein
MCCCSSLLGLLIGLHAATMLLPSGVAYLLGAAGGIPGGSKLVSVWRLARDVVWCALLCGVFTDILCYISYL